MKDIMKPYIQIAVVALATSLPQKMWADTYTDSTTLLVAPAASDTLKASIRVVSSNIVQLEWSAKVGSAYLIEESASPSFYHPDTRAVVQPASPFGTYSITPARSASFFRIRQAPTIGTETDVLWSLTIPSQTQSNLCQSSAEWIFSDVGSVAQSACEPVINTFATPGVKTAYIAVRAPDNSTNTRTWAIYVTNQTTLGTNLIKKYMANRKAEEASNATINREMTILKRAFNLAGLY